MQRLLADLDAVALLMLQGSDSALACATAAAVNCSCSDGLLLLQVGSINLLQDGTAHIA